MSFNVELYATKSREYKFSFPIDSRIQSMDVASELGITLDQLVEWKPRWAHVPMYSNVDFLKVLTDNDYLTIKESHSCREVAITKGIWMDDWCNILNGVIKNSHVILSHENQVPEPFKAIVTQALLKAYAVNSSVYNIWCDLDNPNFTISMHPAYWKKPWLSLLTYFVKYAEFLEHLYNIRYPRNTTASIDEVVRIIMDSWSGEVGFYTAFGFWRWYSKDMPAIRGFDTNNGMQFNGIHNAMDTYTRMYQPRLLIEFVKTFDLDLNRVNEGFLSNYELLCTAEGLSLPRWFTRFEQRSQPLSYSPEYSTFMGNDDEDDYDEEEDVDWYAEDDYDEEEW